MPRVTDVALSIARRLKHRAELVRRRTVVASAPAQDAVRRGIVRVLPLAYRPQRYATWFWERYLPESYTFPVNHLVFDAPAALLAAEPQPCPPVVWCLWTGDNEMPDVRRESFEQIVRANPDLDVRLVTPANLADYVLPDRPLHPAYEHLSLVHRSDYLRAYLMHFHGGAYADIKPVMGGWSASLARLNASDAWCVGRAEPVSTDTFRGPSGRMGRDLKLVMSRIPSQTNFAFKPGTALSAEWYAEACRRLDYYADVLAAHPGDARGTNPSYPVAWYSLLATILKPLYLKYIDKVIVDDAMNIDVTRAYR